MTLKNATWPGLAGVTLMLVALMLGSAGASTGDPLPIGVRLCLATDLRDNEVHLLRSTVDRAFAPADIRIEWIGCADGQMEVGRIIARIVDQHGKDAGRCGFAMTDGHGPGFVSLSRGCVLRTRASLERRGTLVDLELLAEGEMLGIVLAHEITHVLLPGIPHSPRGLFKSRLHAHDWDAVRRQRLRFMDRDISRLRDATLQIVTPDERNAASPSQYTDALSLSHPFRRRAAGQHASRAAQPAERGAPRLQ